MERVHGQRGWVGLLKGRLAQNAPSVLQVATAISSLEQRLGQEGSRRELTAKEKLVLRLNHQYPSDVGVLSAFFLNLVVLRTGQVPSPPDRLLDGACFMGAHLCCHVQLKML